jgi:hypothetical protein
MLINVEGQINSLPLTCLMGALHYYKYWVNGMFGTSTWGVGGRGVAYSSNSGKHYYSRL